MLKLFDTHTHYDDEAYQNDRDELISNILNKEINGVAGFIAIGCSLKRNKKAVGLSEKYNTVYAAVGIHPSDTHGLPNGYLNEIAELAAKNKTVAIGEIGLDYHYDNCDRNVQLKVFEEQLELAASLKIPVIIHSRDATEDTMKILQKHKPQALMHCFSGSAETALELVGMGVMLSFTGVLTFKNARRAVEAVKAVPIEMLMLETDCPYMAPTPFRGQRCDSTMAWYTAAKLAEIKHCTTEEVVLICNNNAKKFFNINF